MEENETHKPTSLRDLRRSLHLSQKQVARRIGHPDQTLLSRYEHGRAIPPLLTAMKLSLLYQVPLARLFPELTEKTKVEILNPGLRVQRTHRKVCWAEQGAV